MGGTSPGSGGAIWGGFAQLRSLALPLLAVVVAPALLSWTLVLIPIAIYLLVRWQFFSQAVILGDARGLTPPLGRSWGVTAGRWWRTLMVTLAFQLLGSLPGPLIGVVLLVIGGGDVRFANAVSSVPYAALVPLAVIGIILAYHRLRGAPVVEPHMTTRERDPKKAARTRDVREEALRLAGVPAER